MHNECVTQAGVTDEQVAQVMAGNFLSDPEVKEQIFCMTKKLGFLNDAGEIQMDIIEAMIAEFVPDAALAEKLKKCGVQKDTPQDTAFELAKCAYQAKFDIA